MKRLTPILMLLLLLCPLARGQQSLKHISLGVNAGGMNYIGDLNHQSMFGKVDLGFGGLFRYHFDSRWNVGIDAAYGHVSGGNPDYIKRRNLSFSSSILEASMRVEFNFLPFGSGDRQFQWTPYIFGGFGLFAFKPTATYLNAAGETVVVELQPLHTEGQGSEAYPDRKPYALTDVMMPFGLGFRFKPNEMLSLGVEYGFRKTWTDYIDDVSTTYVSKDILNYYCPDGTAAMLADRSAEVEPGFVNAPGMQRGDDSLDDWYAYFNLYVTFRLDKVFWFVGKKRCDMKH